MTFRSAIGFCAATLLTLGVVLTPVAAPALAPPSVPATTPLYVLPAADRDVVRQAQRLLNQLGYDAGAVDGLAGPKADAAVRAFQSDSGIGETGRIDAALLRALQSATRSPAPAPAPRIVAAPPPPTPVLSAAISRPTPTPRPAKDLRGETWRFIDDNDGQMVLTFREDGRVTGPAFADGFNWRQDKDALWLTYQSPLGGKVTRQGELGADGVMTGTAQSDRGLGPAPRANSWTWRAERVR